MTKGTLGIIICPMNDDHLIYSICNDRDVGRLVLLDNEFSGMIRSKLEKKGVKFELIPEKDFDEGEVEFDPEIFNVVIKTDDLALHAEPQELRAFVEKQVIDIQPLVDAVGLYFGLCGNYGWDATQWAKDNGYKPTAVYRSMDGKVCDDCVAIAIGGTERYKKLEKQYVGMFYLTPAIADNWDDFMGAGDMGKQLKSIPRETLEELGIHNQNDYMRWMFELGHYQYILKIDTGLADTKRFDSMADDIGRLLNLRPIVPKEQWATIECAEALYAECKGYLS